MPKTPRKMELIEAAPFKIDGVYCRLVPLSRGMYAIVDEADYATVACHKWTTHKDRRTVYASRRIRCTDKTKRQIDLKMHRVIMGAAADGFLVDHINGLGWDNRRGNLRRATYSQNTANCHAPTRNKLGVPGISLRPRGVFRVRVCKQRRRIHVGDFATMEQAHAAYLAALLTHHGEFASRGTQ